MSFRRKWGTPVWHWTPACSAWPFPLQSEERDRHPTHGELCPECQAKAPLTVSGPASEVDSETRRV